MGYTTSAVHGIEVPDFAEANNVPEDIGKVVTALEGGSFARRLTGAQIAALTGAQKTAGVLVYNTTTNRLQISDGSAFRDLPRGLYAAWTATAQSLTAGTWNTLTQTSEDDPENCMSGGVFTAPAAGLYRVDGYARVESAGGAADNIFVLRVQQNGSTDIAAQASSTPNVAVDHYLAVTATVRLAAADTLRLAVYNGAAASRPTLESRMTVTRSA